MHCQLIERGREAITDYKKMFEPMKLKHMTIKNRIVRSATNSAMSNTDGSFSSLDADMFEELAVNQVGMMITGHTYVSPQGQAKPNQPSMCKEKWIPAMKDMTDRVHSHGAKIVAQISHAGAGALVTDQPAAPSRMFAGGGRIAHAMTHEEIKDTVRAFGQSAMIAKQSGFDGVQVHVAHGFLLCEFVSYGYNQRTDEYGGSADNRIRIVREIIEEIKKTCGEEYPVFVKINSNSYYEEEAYWQDMFRFVDILEAAGAEALELSGYDFSSFPASVHCFYLDRAAALKKYSNLPLILVGGIRNLEDMEKVLEAGVDMVSMARPFICEPDLIPRLMGGQENSSCINCNNCHGLFLREGRRCIMHKG